MSVRPLPQGDERMQTESEPQPLPAAVVAAEVTTPALPNLTITGSAVPLPALPFSPLVPAPVTALAEHKKKIANRLTPRLANAGYCAVPSVLIRGAHRLRPHEGARGLNTTEVMVLIHLLDRKWDERMPYPALTTIAEEMGLKPRSVRAAVKRLEDLQYIQRYPSPTGGTNKYDLSGLFNALEKLLTEDAEKSDATATTKAEEA